MNLRSRISNNSDRSRGDETRQSKLPSYSQLLQKSGTFTIQFNKKKTDIYSSSFDTLPLIKSQKNINDGSF